jgi:DNA-binding HxlR family transcriptional regulator
MSFDAALAHAFQFLGKRWSGIILAALRHGPAGFADLRRGVGGITDSVLSDRLTELTDAGLVVRTVIDSRPPSVSYRLSSAGENLLPVFTQLAEWSAANLE